MIKQAALVIVPLIALAGCVEQMCTDIGSATGLPSKIANVNGWRVCYLKCPVSWVPYDKFNGCAR